MTKMKFSSAVCVLLSLVLLFSGCGSDAGENPLETTAAPTIPTYEEVANPVTYFSVSTGEDYDHMRRIDVFVNEDGTIHVEYVGDVKKVGDFDANIMHGIAVAFEASGLKALNGKDAYGEGEANASMYVEFADGRMAAVGYTGQIPAEFTAGYEKMNAFFAELTAGLPVYVPQPLVNGQVDATLLQAMLDILNHSGIEMLDAYTISQVEKDEFFAFSLGLSTDEGISAAATCGPMMMTDAFSMVIVVLEDGKKAEDVCADFENTMDWRKWVCVAPSNAILATKDNMVLCLMANEDVYNAMVTGMEHSGWTEVKALKNPDL